MPGIDIGLVTPQANALANGSTWISGDNPANQSGTITSVSFLVSDLVSGLVIIILQKITGDTFTARSYHSLGDKATGLHEDVEVSLAVVTGDYIAYYYTGGNMTGSYSGYSGAWTKSGDYKEADEVAFTPLAGWGLSIAGVGAGAGGGQRALIIG